MPEGKVEVAGEEAADEETSDTDDTEGELCARSFIFRFGSDGLPLTPGISQRLGSRLTVILPLGGSSSSKLPADRKVPFELRDIGQLVNDYRPVEIGRFGMVKQVQQLVRDFRCMLMFGWKKRYGRNMSCTVGMRLRDEQRCGRAGRRVDG